MNCQKCGGETTQGIAIVNTLSWGDDFGGESSMKTPPEGVTVSRTGKAVKVECEKCTICGHSFIPEGKP